MFQQAKSNIPSIISSKLLLTFLVAFWLVSITTVLTKPGIRQTSKKKPKLKLVQMICRHGDRSPEWTPDHERDQWLVYPGHLTATGMKQASQIGQYLKKYIKMGLIKSEYDFQAVQFFSTSYSRTIQTALTVGASMFSSAAKTTTMTQHNVDSRPVCYPVPYSTHEFDVGVKWESVCPAYARLLKRKLASEAREDYEYGEEYRGLFREISKHFNKTFGRNNAYELYDLLFIENILGKMRPYVSDAMTRLLRLATFDTLYKLVSSEYRSDLRLAQGFKSIFRNIDRTINNLSSYELLFYAAHDITLFGWLQMLNATIPDNIGYVAFLTIELYEMPTKSYTDDDYFLKLYLFPGTYETTFNITHQDISEKLCPPEGRCWIGDMRKRLSFMLDMDYEKECRGHAKPTVTCNFSLMLIVSSLIAIVSSFNMV